MKKKLQIILPAGLIVLALVSVIVVRQGGANRKDLPEAQQSTPAEETPAVQESETPEPQATFVLPSDRNLTGVKVLGEEAEDGGSQKEHTSGDDTITTKPDGTIVITPDFDAQISRAVTLVDQGSQAEANMGGGGGDLELGEDGVFHGTPPTPAPAATPAPTPAPVATTSPQQEPSAPQSTPAADPSQGSQQPQGGPPSYNGTYDGQISPDGKYEWWDMGSQSQWVDRSSTNGGMGGQIDDSDLYAPGTGLTGHKVGEM